MDGKFFRELTQTFKNNYNPLTPSFFSDCIQYKVDTSRLVSNDGQVSDVRLDDTWQYLMVVRDPIDRFLSGYLHFCY